MRVDDAEDRERILDSRIALDLTLNDLRILSSALDAMVYWGEEDGEEYLDENGLSLRTRLRSEYCAALKKAGAWEA